MSDRRDWPVAARGLTGMRRRWPAWLCAGVLVGMLAGPAVWAAPVRIMPLGDSITYGVGDESNHGGYRGPLYDLLVNAGDAVDFVGTLTGGAIPDPNNEGHSGWRADQVRDQLNTWLTLNPPDIVLLHIGTNDITAGETVSTITAEIGQILDIVDAFEAAHGRPITVVVARIINRNDSFSGETTTLNGSIADMVDARAAAGDLVTVVDQEAALTYPNDLADTLHPNAGGYAKMAGVWYAALVPLLRNRADFVSDTIPNVMIPGHAYDCGVTMLNSGHDPWSCAAGTRLTVTQSGGPVANVLAPDGGYAIPISPCTIAAGQQGVFAFTVNMSADATYGQYELAWQMRDDSEWFNSNGHVAVFRQTIYVRPYPFFKGDFDDDGDVDQDDFGHMQLCLSGTGVVQSDPNCFDARLAGSLDVGTADLAIFIQCHGGEGVMPGANCIK